MSDASLRELERGWLAGRAPFDGPGRLAGRQRMGELDRGGLELAAFVGSTAARMLVPEVAPWSSQLGQELMVAWGPFPALHGSLALLRWALAVSEDAAPGEVQDLADATAELLAAPSEEWIELIGSLGPSGWEVRCSPVVALTARGVWEAVDGLLQDPARSAQKVWETLSELPERERAEADPLARAAIVARALASPQDPAGPWQAEARWLEERERGRWLSGRELALLHECGFRPAGILLGRAPLPEVGLEGWLDRLLARKVQTDRLGRALLAGAEPHRESPDSGPCSWCAAADANLRGCHPEEVVAIRLRDLGRWVELGVVAPALYELERRIQLFHERVSPAPSRQDLLDAARAVGPWLARRRIAAGVVGQALQRPESSDFGRQVRKRARRPRRRDGRTIAEAP